MNYQVGTKGQVVIDRSIRKQLGIEPGWVATQRVVGDRVEIRFHPPRHTRSAKGILAQHIDPVPTGEDWDTIRSQAWERSLGSREDFESAGK